jgi:hypothetical protein
VQRATPHRAVSYVCIIHGTCLTGHTLLRPLYIGHGCAGGEWPAWCTCRLSRSGFDITAMLEALAGQEELEALCDRVLNAQTVVDRKEPPA